MRWIVSDGEYTFSKVEVHDDSQWERGGGPALLSPAYFSTFAHPTLVDTTKNHSLDV
jgi:hypothetical protein